MRGNIIVIIIIIVIVTIIIVLAAVGNRQGFHRPGCLCRNKTQNKLKQLSGNKATPTPLFASWSWQAFWGRRKGLRVGWGDWGVTSSGLCLIPLFLPMKLEKCLLSGAVLTRSEVREDRFASVSCNLSAPTVYLSYLPGA